MIVGLGMGGSVVWILGAGFSRPLGGPLLADLMTSSMQHQVESHFDATAAQRFETVRRVFTKGEGSLWTNAEDFLLYLSEAETSEAKRKTLGPFVSRDTPITNFYKQAVRATALASSAFLGETPPGENGAILSTERWLPFRTWRDRLEPGDTVVTFNYDTVPEVLGLHARLPDAESTSGVPTVLKLHGSINWHADDNQILGPTVHQHGWNVALKSHGRPAIGIPGSGKALLGRKLKSLWDAAKSAIENASAIVIVGYRFPETDNFAKKFLVEAIRGASGKAVFIVLGDSPDVVRLEHLLYWARISTLKIRNQHMRTEDFLPVFDRGMLMSV